MTTEASKNVKNIKEEAYKLCQEFLGDTWAELPISEFKISPISGGLSNFLYRCCLPENTVVKNPKTPREVLLRIYGPFQENMGVVLKEVTTYIFLAERKLGPKLFGVFPNGRLEEFIPSRTLLHKDYRLMHQATAREVAKIHALDVPIRKIPDFWFVKIQKWLNELEVNMQEKRNSSFAFSNLYKESIAWLSEKIKKSNSSVVFCHNDLLGGNILFRDDSPSEKDPRLTLIDFEFGAYNYRGFDLANHLLEWCYDYSNDEYPYYFYKMEDFPTEEEQVSFIRAYLGQLVEEGVMPLSSVEREVKVVLEEIELFSMAVNLLWALWSWKMTFLEGKNFGFEEFGHIRLNHFKATKKKYLDRMLNNGNSASEK